MKNIITLLFLALATFCAAQSNQVKTPGVSYSAGAPNWVPVVKTASELAIDTVTKRIYLWNRTAGVWNLQGRGVDQTSGATAPAYTPGQTDSYITVNNANPPEIWIWNGSSWSKPPSGVTYTAGSGISITGTTIANTGDLSATNELNTGFDISGGNLRITDAGATRTVPIASIAPDQSITNEIQAIDTLRVNGANLELSISQDGQPAKTLPISSIAPVQAVAAGTGISIAGTTTRTITNTAPDQTVSITGAGINAVTGTYPNFTVTGTEVDGSTTNELQNLSLSGQSLGITSGTGVTLPIVDVVAGTGVTVSKTAGTATVNSSGITALTGDVTASGPGSAAATIASGAVTMAKINQAGATSGQVIAWNGSAWAPANSSVGAWSTSGNSATAGSSFLGTTNNTSLRFRTNNVQRMILDSLGFLGVGTSVPSSPVTFSGSFAPASGSPTYFRLAPTTTIPSTINSQITALNSVTTSATYTNTNQFPIGLYFNHTVNSNSFSYNQSQRGSAFGLQSDCGVFYGSQNKSSGEPNTDAAFVFIQQGSVNNSSMFSLTKNNSARGNWFIISQDRAAADSAGTIKILSFNENITAKRFATTILQEIRNNNAYFTKIFQKIQQATPTLNTSLNLTAVEGNTEYIGLALQGRGVEINPDNVDNICPAQLTVKGNGNNNSTYSLIVTNNTYNTSTPMMSIRDDGQIYHWATNTATGTTGAQTINRPSGTVNFAAGATSLVVTNNLVTASSIVFAVVRTNDATAVVKNVVPASGSFTINLNAAATSETSVGFFVIN